MSNKEKDVRCLVQWQGQYYPVKGQVYGMGNDVLEISYKFMGKRCTSVYPKDYAAPVIGGKPCFPVVAGRLAAGVFTGDLKLDEAPVSAYFDSKAHIGMMEAVRGKEGFGDIVKWLVIAGLAILAFMVFKMQGDVGAIKENVMQETITREAPSGTITSPFEYGVH